jgi:hypothetical protein
MVPPSEEKQTARTLAGLDIVYREGDEYGGKIKVARKELPILITER